MYIGSSSIEVRETNHLIQTATYYTNDKKQIAGLLKKSSIHVPIETPSNNL